MFIIETQTNPLYAVLYGRHVQCRAECYKAEAITVLVASCNKLLIQTVTTCLAYEDTSISGKNHR